MESLVKLSRLKITKRLPVRTQRWIDELEICAAHVAGRGCRRNGRAHETNACRRSICDCAFAWIRELAEIFGAVTSTEIEEFRGFAI